MGLQDTPYWTNNGDARERQASKQISALESSKDELMAHFTAAERVLGRGYIDLSMYIERSFPENEAVIAKIREIFPRAAKIELREDSTRVWAHKPSGFRRILASVMGENFRY